MQGLEVRVIQALVVVTTAQASVTEMENANIY